MNSYTIREATTDDLSGILELWSMLDRHVGLPDLVDYLHTLLQFTGELLLVAESNGEIVGTIIGGWDGWRGHMARLATHPDIRRRGIGSGLLREAERRLTARGARRIYALVDRRNPLAAPFWRALGYDANENIIQYSRNFDVIESND